MQNLPDWSSAVKFIGKDSERRLATRNLASGSQVYGEKLVSLEGAEYRLWSPYRSKLSAAIINGMKRGTIGDGWRVLYLGAATGTTASHVSDIVGVEGAVFCVEFAPRPMKELLRITEDRPNMVPLMADARRPETYAHLTTEVDFIYQDVAQPNQSEIFRSNAGAFLAPGGGGLLMVKSRSVDVSLDPGEVFASEVKNLSDWGFEVLETVNLAPFDKDHMAIAVKSR